MPSRAADTMVHARTHALTHACMSWAPRDHEYIIPACVDAPQFCATLLIISPVLPQYMAVPVLYSPNLQFMLPVLLHCSPPQDAAAADVGHQAGVGPELSPIQRRTARGTALHQRPHSREEQQ